VDRRRLLQTLVGTIALVVAAILTIIGAGEVASGQPAVGWFTAAGWVLGSTLFGILIEEARHRNEPSHHGDNSGTT